MVPYDHVHSDKLHRKEQREQGRKDMHAFAIKYFQKKPDDAQVQEQARDLPPEKAVAKQPFLQPQ